MGSNRGNSREILSGAVRRLSEILRDIRVSSFYITSPRDYIDQPDFLNMAVSGYYAGDCRELLGIIQGIEAEFGRNRQSEIAKGPRTLDIDIELFGDESIREDDLVVPHRELRNRQFVMVPLLELHPDCVDPLTGLPYREACGALPDQGVKKDGKIYGY